MTEVTENDLIDNPTPRCSCMLVLDVSHSMNGAPIQELNEGVRQFLDEVKKDDFARYSVEVGIITFGGKVTRKMSLGPLDNAQWDGAEATGATPMGEAVQAAIDDLKGRAKEYKEAGLAHYRPWLVMMTDGIPTDWYSEAAARLKKLGEDKKMVVFGIGIGDGCDMDVLAEFCPDNRPPKKLDGFKFKDFFAWLSASMSQVSQSTPGTDTVKLPPPDSWTEIPG